MSFLQLIEYKMPSPQLDVLVEELYTRNVKSKQNKQFALSRKNHLRILILNFYHKSKESTDASIVVHRGKNRYKLPHPEYSRGLRYEQTIFALDALIDAEYVIPSSEPKFKSISGSYKATSKLIVEMDSSSTKGIIVEGLIPREGLVFLKKQSRKWGFSNDGEGKPIPFKSTIEVEATRDLLHAQNKLIMESEIGLDGDYRPNRRGCQFYQTYTSIDGSDKLNLHGRFYGHWIQQIPSDDRKRLIVNGEAVCEPDFRSTHSLLLYIHAGVDFREFSGTNESGYKDIYYGFDFPLFDGTPKQKRYLAKRLMNVAMNTKSLRGATNVVRNEIRKEIRDCTLNSKNIREFPSIRDDDGLSVSYEVVKSAMREVTLRHAPIMPYIYSKQSSKSPPKRLGDNLGLKLMYWDSRIATRVLEHFTYTLKEPILCLHESFICRASLKEQLIKVMFVSLQEVTEEHINTGYKLPYSAAEVIKF